MMRAGMTLVEMLLAIVVFLVAISAILGGYLGQQTLNEHARNLTLATQDAERVIEQLRTMNASCSTTPSATMTGGWNAWLNTQVPPKSIPNPNGNAGELIVVTCQDQDGGTLSTDYCGRNGPTPPPQVATEEWTSQAASTAFNPVRVTVAVCWRHRGRTIGECAWNGAGLTPSDSGTGVVGVIESPAMLTTLVTCRG